MKNYIFGTLLTLVIMSSIKAQEKECLTTANMNWMLANAPTRYQKFVDLENFTANYIASQGRLIDNEGLIVIPVVVHVLHHGEVEGQGLNISTSQIQAQLEQLNKDFRRLNEDRINTSTAFQQVAADLNIQFQLACFDPSGNLTTGIIRKSTSVDLFRPVTKSDGTTDEAALGLKENEKGSAAWPTDRYLNIWVCNLAYKLGYATFPADFATYPQYDGIVLRADVVGDIGQLRGRTATHEIGHWLNLRHLDGDGECGDDFCNDTPNEKDQLFGCPTYPEITMLCNPAEPSSMFMNYMEYVNDVCMNLFTNDQKRRTRALFSNNGIRKSLIDNSFKIQEPPLGTLYCTDILRLQNLNCLSPTWTLVSGPANLVSGQGTNQISVQVYGNGTLLVKATALNFISELSVPVSISTPPMPDPINVVLADATIGKLQVEINSVPGASSYRWYKDNVLQTVSYGTFANLSITKNQCNKTYGIKVEAINSCGASQQRYKSVYIPCDNYFIISPNPATNNVSIFTNSTNNSIQTQMSEMISEVKIYDLQGNLKKRVYPVESTFTTIDISTLLNGTYLVEITSAGHIEKKQLVVHR